MSFNQLQSRGPIIREERAHPRGAARYTPRASGVPREFSDERDSNVFKLWREEQRAAQKF